MPPKRAVEALKSAEECILQHGKHGNVIKWREHMQTIVTELYGIVGMFFTTGVRYELPKLSDSSSESSDESDEEVPVVNGPVDQVRTAAAAAAAKAARTAVRLTRKATQSDTEISCEIQRELVHSGSFYTDTVLRNFAEFRRIQRRTATEFGKI